MICILFLNLETYRIPGRVSIDHVCMGSNVVSDIIQLDSILYESESSIGVQCK